MSDAFINIRGDANDAKFVSAVSELLGQGLPLKPNTTTRGEHCVFWLGPDEWLVSTEQVNRADLVKNLEAALSKLHAAVNDVSGGNVSYRLKGADIGDVLAQGCTLDLDAFTVGECAQTGLAKAAVLMSREAEYEYAIIVRRSFADYLRKWLDHAAQGRRIVFL